jgi:hypothetical protein
MKTFLSYLCCENYNCFLFKRLELSVEVSYVLLGGCKNWCLSARTLEYLGGFFGSLILIIVWFKCMFSFIITHQTSGCWCLTPVILATCKAKIGRITVRV